MNSERKSFEDAFPIPAHWIKYNERMNKYYCPYVADAKACEYQARWEAWQASTQRQGYKLVPVEPTKNMMIASSGYSHAHLIYKAMIGAFDD